MADISLFVLHSGSTKIYTLYVDDIIFTGNDSAKVQKFIDMLSNRFSLKDLHELSYFFGVEATRSSNGLLLNQRKYINDLLHRTNMSLAKPIVSPMMASDRLHHFLETTR